MREKTRKQLLFEKSSLESQGNQLKAKYGNMMNAANRLMDEADEVMDLWFETQQALLEINDTLAAMAEEEK